MLQIVAAAERIRHPCPGGARLLQSGPAAAQKAAKYPAATRPRGREAGPPQGTPQQFTQGKPFSPSVVPV